MRGLLILLMVNSHLGVKFPEVIGFRNFIYKLFLSEAEGFYFLSGFTVAIAYFGTPESRVIRRAFFIYTAHLICLLSYAARVYGSGGESGEIFRTVVFGPLLLYMPNLRDLLPLYFVYFLLTPFMFRALKSGRALILLAVSFAIWGATQFFPHNWLFEKKLLFGYFNPFSWQLPFVFGVYFGWAARERRLGHFARARASALVWTLLITVLALLLAVRLYDGTGLEWLRAENWSKPSLGPLRVVNAFCLFLLTAFLVSKLSVRTRFGPLDLWGRRALLVFVLHTFAVDLFSVFQETTGRYSAMSQWGLFGGTFLVLTAAAWIRERGRSAPEQL
ncbi:MAG TPA: OpgC domain-containing protein [Bdellovibrionales bacterium]|nr:OpgC domain-containing protein [Bdellovibrionales bacterium]